MAVLDIPKEAKGGYVLMTTTHGEKYINTTVLEKLKKDKKKKDAKI
jgi:hypothetical protein